MKHLECDSCQDVWPRLSKLGLGWVGIREGGGMRGGRKMLRSAKWRKHRHLSQTEKSARCGRTLAPRPDDSPSFVFCFFSSFPRTSPRPSSADAGQDAEREVGMVEAEGGVGGENAENS